MTHNPLPAPQTRAEIASQLRWLAEHMHDIAVSMEHYCAAGHWATHGRELAGAAELCIEWAEKIEREVGA